MNLTKAWPIQVATLHGNEDYHFCPHAWLLLRCEANFQIFKFLAMQCEGLPISELRYHYVFWSLLDKSQLYFTTHFLTNIHSTTMSSSVVCLHWGKGHVAARCLVVSLLGSTRKSHQGFPVLWLNWYVFSQH